MRSLTLLVLSFALGLLLLAATASAQPGSTRVVVRLRCEGEGCGRPGLKAPTQMDILFIGARRRSPRLDPKDGSFMVGGVPPGEYRYFVTFPGRDMVVDPAPDLQDPNVRCPRNRTCPTITVQMNNHNHRETIVIALRGPAFRQVRRKGGPALRLVFQKASYDPGGDATRPPASQGPTAPGEEEVEEESEPLALPPLEAARRYSFTDRLIQSLPLRGFRNFDDLALLAPGVVPPPQTFGTYGPGVSPGIGTAGQFSINGLRSRENNFTADGSDNNDEDIGVRRQGFLALTPQPAETVQEFQVITALADATYGRNIGGQIDALTQSGSDDFHASLYGFYTDDAMSARDFFDYSDRAAPGGFDLRRAGDGAPVTLDGRPLVLPNPSGGENRLRRTQAGLLAGGRIPVTNTFFFGAAERKVNRETRESHFAVPTVRQRGVFGTGDTGLRSAASRFYPTTLPGNALFSLYPFPNNPLGPYGANTYTAVLPADGDATFLTSKLNQTFGSEGGRTRPWWGYLPIPMNGDILTGRYNFTQDKSVIPSSGGAIFSELRPSVRTQNYALILDRRFSDYTFDTMRFSFGRTRLTLLGSERGANTLPSSTLPDVPFLLNAPLLLNLTLPGPGDTPGQPRYVSASSAEGAALLSSLGYDSLTQTEQLTGPLGQVWIPGFSPVGLDVNHFPQGRVNNTLQVADTLRMLRGRHTFTVGGDLRRTQINSTLERNFRPLAQFNSLRASGAPLPVTGGGGAVLPQQLLDGATLAAAGVPTGFFHTYAGVPNSHIAIRYTQVNAFVQDEVNVRSDLRLTFGVRYQFNTVPKTAGGRVERAFDSEELAGLARDAAARCADPARCADLAAALTTALPGTFRVSFGSDRNDFDGRFGFAWDPGSEGKAVVRGGFGMYSGQFPGVVLSQSRNAFPDFLPLNLANFSPTVGSLTFLFNPANPNLRRAAPNLPGPSAGTLNTIGSQNPLSLLVGQVFDLPSLSPTAVGLDLVLPQKQLLTPYSLQYGAIIERQFRNDYYISGSYVGSRGIKLLRLSTPQGGPNNSRVAFDASVGIQPLGASAFPTFRGVVTPAQPLVSEAFAIAPTFFESSASSTYNSIQLEVRKRYERQLQFGSSLTYAHAIDDASDFFDTDGSFALPQNSGRRSERASSGYDVRWRWVSHALFDLYSDLPLISRAGRLGGWSVAGTITAQTGQPFTVNSAFDVNRDGNLTDRLNTTDGLIVGAAEGDASVRLRLAPGVSPSQLLAPEGRDGAVGRNTFEAPGIFTLDLSLTKNLNFTDRHNFYVRLEMFNIFNRTHFAIPERILESPAFGKAARTLIPARTIQLAFKYSF